jgi:hypothetical protein
MKSLYQDESFGTTVQEILLEMHDGGPRLEFCLSGNTMCLPGKEYKTAQVVQRCCRR